MTEIATAKRCTKCAETLPLTEFHRDRNAPDGHKYACKSCMRDLVIEARQDPEYVERERAASRRWHHANKEAIAAKRKAQRAADPATARANSKRWKGNMTPETIRNQRLRANYGITLEDYHRMLDEQDGRCAICGSTEAGGPWGTFAVDHCHRTGAVRGLLCNPCNMGLGQLGDTIERLEAVLAYVRRSQ